jgi:asparagine synthase (glutamine-hydrolysing)
VITGWVDWARAGPPSGSLRVEKWPDGSRSTRGAWFEVTVAGAHAEIAVADGMVVIAMGAPRFASGESRAGLATRWLEQFEMHSDAAIGQARGRYAVICLDLAKRRAMLATDRFAAWPLCYAVDGARLAFSDRADRMPLNARPALDPQAIFEYLYFHMIPAPRTVFRGVRRLDAAQVLTHDEQGEIVRPHWVPKFEEKSSESFDDLKGEFRRLLTESISRDAESGEIGCFLSGGTDSSTVAGFVGQVTGKPARTFSIGFDADGYDEMEYARIAARHFGTEHHEYYVKPEDLLDGIPRVAGQFDQPFGNSSAVAAYCCSRMAQAEGVRNMLAGDGGDELFGGNTRYAKQRLFCLYERIPTAVRGGFIEPMLLGPPFLRRVPIARKVVSYVEQARMPMPDRMTTYNLLWRLGVSEVLHPQFCAAVNEAFVEAQQREVYARVPEGSLVNRMLAFDWKYTLADNDLPKVRETARLAGVTARFPLLDDDIVDFSLSLAPELKLKGLKLRYFFKEALRGFLPGEILEKQKHGFGLPFGIWLVRHDALRDFAWGSLDRLAERGIVRVEFISDLTRTLIQAHPGYYGEMVWILVMLEQWLVAHESAIRESPGDRWGGIHGRRALPLPENSGGTAQYRPRFLTSPKLS